jgi:carboxylesterase
MTQLLAGAEPLSVDGGPAGALCIHGFGGHPASMRPVAEAFAAAGFSVELPRLPGHGTTVEDLLGTRWADWTAAAEDAHQRLDRRCERVVVAGLSMGGSLALWLAARHPEIAGIVCINPGTRPQPDDMLQMARDTVAAGELTLPSTGADIADRDVVEPRYASTALPPLLSFMDGLAALQADLGSITCPLLLMTSREDHVVDPAQSDHLVRAVGGPVERITLERSYHVATLDYDREIVREQAVAFGRKVTAGSWQ